MGHCDSPLTTRTLPCHGLVGHCHKVTTSFFPKALRRVFPENPLNTDTSTLTLRHLHFDTYTYTHTLEERKHPSAKYASVKVCKSNDEHASMQ